MIRWGIIGCGDVTEVKSGPAFNKVPNSKLVAVMRRDAEKAEDYARRHNVPRWYSDAGALIADPEVDAVYIATPPSSHKEYTIAALKAKKPVYVEKPMASNSNEALEMMELAEEYGQKLVVAHYRREQPLFKKSNELLTTKRIGEVRFIRISLFKSEWTSKERNIPKSAWRLDPAISGGGLFHDLAPHQLDILYHNFGDVETIQGFGTIQSAEVPVTDLVSVQAKFRSGIAFQGLWSFTVDQHAQKDVAEIIGSEGSIRFSFFENKPIELTVNGQTELFHFDPLPHIQQPMIDAVVKYFSGAGTNPCSAKDGVEVMRWIDACTR